MIRGERISAIGKVAPYIKTAYKDVENRAGVKFGEKFLKDVLEEGSAIFSSIPASVALSIFKEEVEKNSDLAGEKNENTLHFAADLQHLIYFEGIESTNISSYAVLAQKYGLEKSDFEEKMSLDKYLSLAQQDFTFAQQLGVNGYPTLIVQEEEKYYLFARGFVDSLPLEKQFETLQQHVS